MDNKTLRGDFVEFRIGRGSLSASELQEAFATAWAVIADSSKLQDRARAEGIDPTLFDTCCFFTFADDSDGEHLIAQANRPAIDQALAAACLDFVLAHVRSSNGGGSVLKRNNVA